MQRKFNNIRRGGKKSNGWRRGIDIVAKSSGTEMPFAQIEIIYSRGIFPKTNINTTVRQI